MTTPEKVPFNKTHWHLSKEVSIATMLAVLSAAGTGMWHIAELKNEQQLLLEKYNNLQNRVDRGDAVNERTVARIESTVTRIEQRLNDIATKK